MNTKIRVLRDRKSLENISINDEIIHLSFRPTIGDLKTLRLNSSIKILQIPPSFIDTLDSNFMWICCDLLNIRIAEGDFIGFRFDLNEIKIKEEDLKFLYEISKNTEWPDAINFLSNRFDDFSPSFISKIFEMMKSGELKFKIRSKGD